MSEDRAFFSFLRRVLQETGDQTDICQLQPVAGGSINRAYRLETKQQRYFLKTNQSIARDFFQQEQKGLTLIRQTRTIGVPKVYGEWYDAETKRGLLLLEWVEGKSHAETERNLGRRLAQMHLVPGQQFGLDEDHYLGYLQQKNVWSLNWTEFYRDYCLLPQIEMGKRQGKIKGQRLRRCEKLLDWINRWLNHQPKSSLLHGNLWQGNWIVGPGGEPYLIDPAVFYGDHELDLAFSECFGGFSESFYQGYQEIFPLDPEYQERKGLYQFLFLLVHLNLFGESYGPSVDRILAYYVGDVT